LNVILVALGSHGDVHPFVGVGSALRERGHRVKVIAFGYFQQLIKDAGLECIPCGTAEEYKALASNPLAWKRFRGSRAIMELCTSLIEPIYRLIAENHVPGQTLLAASSLALGARVAEDHLHIPAATVHLQPSIIRSLIKPPYIQGLFMPDWLPRWMKRAQFNIVDSVVLDPVLAKPLNTFRASLGLAPVRKILGSYIHSPNRVIGFFPDWFAPPQSDWPPQVRLAGFPMFDERGMAKLPDDLVRFLDAGEAPIAFTPGSAMWQGHRFFNESTQACVRLGKRGLLLSRHADHIPTNLPDSVKHVSYAPFSELLPHCAALVHHGGVGTTSQALAAAIPQLVVPHAHDQPDNAKRLLNLGVARKLEVREYKRRKIAKTLGELLESKSIRENTKQVASRFATNAGIDRACDLIEDLPKVTSDTPAAIAQ
jgi:rhamnosyltransferase subunit B